MSRLAWTFSAKHNLLTTGDVACMQAKKKPAPPRELDDEDQEAADAADETSEGKWLGATAAETARRGKEKDRLYEGADAAEDDADAELVDKHVRSQCLRPTSLQGVVTGCPLLKAKDVGGTVKLKNTTAPTRCGRGLSSTAGTG